MQFCSKLKKPYFKLAIYPNLDLLSSHHLPKSKGNLINKKEKNNKLSTTQQQQIEMAQQIMNPQENQVQQVPVKMHPIIRNPEAISDEEIPQPQAQVQVPQMQPQAQVQVPRCSLKHK